MTGQTTQPAMQVVGFHVEGASPSPAAHGSILQGAVMAGSPTPVIIPPNFQREPGQRALTSQDSGSLRPAPEAVVTTPAPPATPATSIGIGPAANSAQQTQVSAGDAQPEACTSSAKPATAPRPIQYPSIAEAAHAGLPRIGSVQDSMTSEASPVSTVSAGVFSLEGTTRATPPAPQSPFAASSTQQQAAPAPAPAPAAPAAIPIDTTKPKPMKEMTKAERRALQESQRAAKAAAKAGGAAAPPAKATTPAAPADTNKAASKGAAEPKPAKGQPPARPAEPAAPAPRTDAGPVSAQAAPAAAPEKKKKDPKVVSLNSTELFAHLQQYRKTTVSSLLQQPTASSIHPAIVQLGLRYADGSIRGANARCMAMLNAFCQVIHDYTTPEGKELNRDLLRHLNDTVNFLVLCRPLSVGMGNAIRHLKLQISRINPTMPDAKAKELLIEEISNYLITRITNADKQLTKLAASKVDNGDVVLTYAASYCVTAALVAAAAEGKRFKVIVMDSRPEYEGRITLQKLLAAGVPSSYVHLNASSYIIKEATKVILGAAAVLSNGTVLSRAGAASVAMMAHAHNVPVLVCCETHKFNERVQLDSITHNELGDPEELASVQGRPEINSAQGWNDHPRLRLLNLKYDVMPAEFVTMIVTEFGMVPTTSVPVILREFRNEPGGHGAF